MTKNIPLAESVNLVKLGYIPFAQVGRPHGLKGCFFLKTDDRRTQWPGYKTILLETQNALSEKKVVRTYLSGGALIVELDGITRTDVEAFYNKKIYVHKSEIKVQKDEFLVHDLLNFTVITSDKKLIGKISGVISYGAQENLEIELSPEFKLESGSQHTHVLYPFIDKYVHSLNYENAQIEIEYLEDFLVG